MAIHNYIHHFLLGDRLACLFVSRLRHSSLRMSQLTVCAFKTTYRVEYSKTYLDNQRQRN